MSSSESRRLSSSRNTHVAQSRRGSIVSNASKSAQEKQALSQALDQLHTTASRSNELTAFPPPPSSAIEERGRPGQQSGLGGIYHRLKASVTGTVDVSEPTPRPGSADSRDASAKRPRPPPLKQQDGLRDNVDRSPSVARSRIVSPTLQTAFAGTLSIGNDQPQDAPAGLGIHSSRAAGHIDADVARVIEPLPKLSLQNNRHEGGETCMRSHSTSRGPGTRAVSAHDEKNPNAPNGSLEVNEPSPAVSSQSKADLLSPTKPSLSVVTALDEPVSAFRSTSQSQSNTAHRREGSRSSTALSDRPDQHRPEGDRPQDIHRSAEAKPHVHVAPTVSEREVPKPDSTKTIKRAAKPSTSKFMHQMRRKILSRDFWMKDENAKVCFGCGDSFSTFRRKHHCRLCGQIFCSSCTNLVSGKPFGQASKLRVCKTCETMMNGDDSSDYSEDDDTPLPPQIKQIRFSETPRVAPVAADDIDAEELTDGEKIATPSSGSSAFRRSRDGRRRSVQPDHTIVSRPSSSRSLKSAIGRPRSSSHKTRRLRTQHMRSLGVADDEGVPFQQQTSFMGPGESSLGVLHTDSVIDPDLAAFLSDEDSSEDETPNIAAALTSDFQDQPTGLSTSIFGALRRARSYGPNRQNNDQPRSARDADNASVDSARNSRLRRQLGSRSVSVTSFSFPSSSPRAPRADTFLASSDNLHAMALRGAINLEEDRQQTDALPGSTPSIADAGLNLAGLDHVKKLLRQFLKDAHIEHVRQWEKALVPIILRCAADVDPNIHRGDDIDIRQYVKLKKAAGGSPADTSYISGVVFSKNVALKSMPRHISRPRILLISFSIVYARHQQHFMSLEPVIAQEREYLRNLVGRIKALRPNVLLVQRDVSGLALQFLNEAHIVVAYNVKGSVLQAVSRCTQTRIVTSAERLNTSYNALGTCGSFDVKTYVNLKVKRTFMSFSGCLRDLGCTVVLRGASLETLSRLKWITEFMCYVTYNLKLETCLMRDEFAALPAASEDVVEVEQTSVDALDHHASRPNTASDPDKHEMTTGESQRQDGEVSHDIVKRDKASPAGPYDALVGELAGRLLSASPLVKLAEPWMLLRGKDCEQRMARIRKLQQAHKPHLETSDEKHTESKFEIIRPEAARRAGSKASACAKAVQYAMREAEHELAQYQYGSLKRTWDRFTAWTPNFLSPLSHQRIMVSFSIISTPTLDACDGPELLELDFYQEHDIDENLEPDVPLGEYVERLCNQADSHCTANRCDKRMIDHHRQYVHGDGQVNFYLQKYASRFKGMENTILMWSVCRKCQQETQITPMSGNTWKYSFAKYLELSFWAKPLTPKTGFCTHDIHRDHIRYFGFKNYAIRVQYDKINIVDIAVPRTTVIWSVEKDLRLKNNLYLKAEERLVRFSTSVRQRIQSINIATIAPDKLEACKSEIEKLSAKAHNESELLIKKLQEEYTVSQYYELIPMNRAARFVQEKVAEWDTAFADFERDYFPSEKDIRRLAALQIRKVFLEREDSDGGDGDEKSANDKTTTEIADNEKTAHHVKTIEESDIPLEDMPTLVSDSASKIGSMPIESLFSPTTSTSLKDSEQLVQTLDLAIPEPAIAMTSPPASTQLPTDVMSPILLTEVRRPSIAPAPHPHPLEAEIVQKVEAMQSTADEIRPHTPENGPSNIGDVTESALAVMPPMLRSKTQPDMPTWPDPDTPVKPSVNAESTTQNPFANFTSRIPLAPSTLLVDRMGMSAMRTGKGPLQSMIPRAVKKQESKVSALAKHFEEMSREFEKERLRERRQRAVRNQQSRAYPMMVSRPIVEVFRDAHEAVEERDVADSHADDTLPRNRPQIDDFDDDPFGQTDHDIQEVAQAVRQEPQQEAPQADALPAEQVEDDRTVVSYSASDIEATMSDNEDTSMTYDTRASLDFSDNHGSLPDQQQDDAAELPKHEKTSLLKMLTSFWSERSASGWTPLDYPLASTDHIFADSDIIVREDEPSSLIAFALASEDYSTKLQKFRERAMTVDVINAQSTTGTADTVKCQADIDVERVMLGKTATHMKYQFQAGSARMLVKVFYAESFDAIRRKCGVEPRFVESLSRSIKWDSKGGKTKSLFLKTLDERFILKSLSAIETQSFLKFAPDYFDYMSKCLFHGLPSALAKMLGFYQVVIKNPATGTDLNYFLQVMENVFYETPTPMRMFDLKGSMRNRRIQATGEADEVLLDENLLDYISAHPIYVRAHSNSLLASSIQNDTLFCSKQNVMDYSLIAGLYDIPNAGPASKSASTRQELCVGIIDYIRTYTWDKKIESWIKDRGKHKPTVMGPKDYRTRFRKSMPRYFPLVPGPWQVFGSGGPGRSEADADGLGGVGRGEETVDEEEEAEGQDEAQGDDTGRAVMDDAAGEQK